MNGIFAQSARLNFREMHISHAMGMFELNQDPIVNQFTGDGPFESVKAAQDFIKNYPDFKVNGYGRWSLFLKESDEYIGFCGLKKHAENGEVDLGYRLKRAVWGQGLATEAAAFSLNYGFQTLKLKRIIGRAHRDNSASIHILKKLGMQWIETFEEDGQPWVLYAIHADDYETGRYRPESL